MERKTLVILGNGFDLKCGLHSSYKDFFDHQIKCYPNFKTLFKYLKNNKEASFNENKINEIIPLMSLEKELSFFDLYFLVSDWRNGFLQTNRIWSAIEDMLLSGITASKNSISFNICHSVFISIKSKDYYFFYQHQYAEKIIGHYLYKLFDGKTLSENLYHDFLIKELNKFSINFARYITNQTSNNDEYMHEAQVLLTKITGVGLNECKIISFNYTDPFITPDSANIHGLASKNEIVFGVTCDQGNGKEKCHHDWSYKMSKEYKIALIMSEGQKVSLDYNGIKDIYVYGLSLGEQDYDFFENLFDQFDFLMRSYESKIHFCYSIYNGKTKDEVAEEITGRVTNLINKFGDSHENYGLLRSMIQKGNLDIRFIG